MTEFIVKDTSRGNERECESRSEAEETRDDMISLGASPGDLVIESVGDATPDGGQAEVVETEPVQEEPPEPTTTESDLPDDPSIQDDPVDWLPQHFIDTIQGVPTVNRKGYAVIASKYNVSVTAEPVTLASETDFEYAEFRAIATTESGEEYSGFGSAHVDRMDGDDQYLLNELAETRALKRATAWSTGVGLTAIEELKGEL